MKLEKFKHDGVKIENMEIQQNILLKEFTTFKVGGSAKYYARIEDPNDLADVFHVVQKEQVPYFVMGGGSNMVVSDGGYNGLVINLDFKGISHVFEDKDFAVLSVNSGEIWDKVVAFAVEQGLWGIENLSHIPGKMGAFAVQNVGAYGQEAKDVVVLVRAFDTLSKEFVTLTNEQCGFAYRKSIFNTGEIKGRYIIVQTLIRLSKHPNPNLTYPDLKNRFYGKETPTQQEIRQAIIEIRDTKFPFPREAKGGNAGSFFKNLTLNEEQYEVLKRNVQTNFEEEVLTKLVEMRSKFSSGKNIKVPTAFLIDICGLKGYVHGGVKVNENQPMILMNTGTATAADVMSVFKHVRRAVYQKTGMVLENEPELIGFGKDELENYFMLD